MENLQLQETPRKEEAMKFEDCKTPPLQDFNKSLNSTNDLRKNSTPDPLKVPKAFNYPERYRSPTDLMVSPITKGILARNRKWGAASLLPPSINQTKIQEDVVSFQIE